ncbi:uncharacterized protein NECHADRAFT_100038 [Fusarium vanettenii 77-13-4]|uniref:Fibroin-3 n=1 Tax=Fusarium vanettenii (strain ATCC MYA-4622 / CBS 123669 / FGSC 9596 / NRRL 45880 / 77-13-4) TaxID=660122 RepID=C7YQ49_FUSV7|nr:uncharacterized protein NECHADRAFT_100038 [Fusarium vanettenii 77-13-4]EEU45961.1 hypothetical protein NECHADRAFT_100038 [Fusarium vanettenii 77-13-4]
MPSIDEAMARSLRASDWEIVKDKVIRSLAAGLVRRQEVGNAAVADAAQKVDDFATAFSSWDNCMTVPWCNCFQCLQCCGNCCGACDPPGGRKIKHLDDPYAPQNQHHGYRSEPPMNPSTMNSTAPQFAPAPKSSHSEPPQYAEFEMSKPRNDDALPEMPSWDEASNKKVMVHEEAVELDSLAKKPATGQQVGVMNNGSGRLDPYSQPTNNSNGYLAHNQAQDAYSPIDHQAYNYNSIGGNGYSDQAFEAPTGNERYGQGQGYGQMQGYGQSSVQNDHANYGGYRGGPSPAPQGFGARQAPQDDFNGYRQSPAPQNDYAYAQPARQSPAPQHDYGYGQQSHTPAPETHYGSHPVPQRQYPQEPQSPINNNSGFDFNSGFARPQRSPTYEAYPGAKPYQF